VTVQHAYARLARVVRHFTACGRLPHRLAHVEHADLPVSGDSRATNVIRDHPEKEHDRDLHPRRKREHLRIENILRVTCADDCLAHEWIFDYGVRRFLSLGGQTGRGPCTSPKCICTTIACRIHPPDSDSISTLEKQISHEVVN
jgi:hypothetical protein